MDNTGEIRIKGVINKAMIKKRMYIRRRKVSRIGGIEVVREKKEW